MATKIVFALLASLILLPVVSGCTPKEQAKSRQDQMKSMDGNASKMPADVRRQVEAARPGAGR